MNFDELDSIFVTDSVEDFGVRGLQRHGTGSVLLHGGITLDVLACRLILLPRSNQMT